MEYVGIIVTSGDHKRINRGKKFKRLSFYEEGGKKYGVTPCYFRLKDIDTNHLKVQALVKKGIKSVNQRIEIPKVIYNRSLPTSDKNKILPKLRRNGYTIFNDSNYFNKFDMHQQLSKNEYFHNYLPETLTANRTNLNRMMKKYQTLILKKKRGSLGIGIMILTKERNNWYLSYRKGSSEKWHRQLVKEMALPKRLRRVLASGNYIVQQKLELANIGQRPFDVRVCVQRNPSGDWQVTGMVARLARKGAYVTNAARGASLIPVDKVLNGLNVDTKKMMQTIEELAIRSAIEMEKYRTHLGDLGIDIAISNEGHPYFIECNGRHHKYIYRKGGMMDVWKDMFITPIGYARYLLDQLKVPENQNR